jgi:transcriptional regulator with XRE-family HTH domain
MGMPEIIKKRRDELNLTLLDIAKKVGVSEATVQRYESGQIKNIRQDKIVKLASALQLTPAQLLGWNDTQTQEAEFPANKSNSNDTKQLTTDSDEIIGLLEKIASLHAKGILTDEEYTGKKRELLNRL